MAIGASKKSAIVGAADHCGWAVLVTVAHDGGLIDRRRVELIEGALPRLPHHHEAQGLPAREAVALVERVRASADACARAGLEGLAAAVSAKIAGIAIRRCPPLPETIAERIADYRAQCVADTVMYRDALADAARARGWFVHWYDAKRVFAEAAGALERATIDQVLEEAGASVGPPWRKDHRVAMAAAISAIVPRG